MASASTLRPTSSRPRLGTRNGGRRKIVAFFACLLASAALLVSRPYVGVLGGTAIAGLISVCACSFWFFHLQAGGLPAGWAAIFASLVTAQSLVWLWRRPATDFFAWMAAFGCGAFGYAMLWVFKSREREPGLRSLATAALLLSIGILAKPPLLICCALLSIIVFFDERRRVGGMFHFELLLLTPVVLSLMTIGVLHAFGFDDRLGLSWIAWKRSSPPAASLLAWLADELPALWLCLAACLSRLVARKTCITDLALLFIMIFLITLGRSHWMPEAVTSLDISMILGWSAASLLALDPPEGAFSCSMVVVGASLSIWASWVPS